MQRKVIPIDRGSHDGLTKLYLHLLFAVLNEKAVSTAAKEQPEYLSTQNQAFSSRHRQACTSWPFPR